jgi:hypothetical protein
MKTTARFEIERQKQLAQLFTQARLIQVWRKLVRQQLRRQAILDLHDYHDFNSTIGAQADSIIERVLSGQYRAEVPVIFKMEKKLGICRHMMIPSPSDALVFQVLADGLYEPLIKAQPSKRAFYARDRHATKLPHEVAQEQSYPWYKLWPKFQEQIWGFSESFPLLVTTDVTNYFDNIGFEELRRVIAATATSAEVLLDLLFTLIQDLAWSPDYLPRTPRGLPVIHIEAPRLLAHAFLYEIDRVLKHRTNDSFVRWMDDINFGVKSRHDANRILGEVNDVLKSRGLALNLGKTEILTSREARAHFLVAQNKRLSRQQGYAAKLKSIAARANLAAKVFGDFKVHLATCTERTKDKLTKRYLTVLGALSSPLAIESAVEIFLTEPALREAAVRYISTLSFSSRTRRAFVTLLSRAPRYDDMARLEVIKGIVAHNVPYDSRGKRFATRLNAMIGVPLTGFDWYGVLLFLAKYGEPNEILAATDKARRLARVDSFLSRQITAVLARAAGVNFGKIQRAWHQEVSRSAADSASVAVSLLDVSSNGFPTKSKHLYLYLFPKKAAGAYPLAKFLILCALAGGERFRGRNTKRPEVAQFVLDPWMQAALRQLHPPWFG